MRRFVKHSTRDYYRHKMLPPWVKMIANSNKNIKKRKELKGVKKKKTEKKKKNERKRKEKKTIYQTETGKKNNE